MAKSMTGYGANTVVIDNMEISFEMKSVNNRFLDISLKVPRIYGYLEEKIKKEIQANVSRGKVDVYLTVNVLNEDNPEITLNRGLLESYLKLLREVCAEYEIRNDISTSTVMRIPDIFNKKKSEEDTEKMWERVRAAAVSAIADYNEMRTVEGEKLCADINSKLNYMSSLMTKIKALSPESIRNYEIRLRTNVEKLLNTTNIDESRILTEVAIFADKVAIDEELTRLESHLAQFRKMLRQNGSVGKPLDFLIQEINREINTIGSKCSEIEISKLVIELKSELEKVREQIQNIE